MGQGAHADPCQLPKAATVGTWASELDHGAMEECGLVWCITFSFTSLGWPGACCLPGESGCTMGKRQAGEGSDALGDVLLGNLGSCHVHVDATLTCSTYLKWKQYFLVAVASFSRIMVQEWLEEHNLDLASKFPKTQINPIEHLWDVLNKQVRSNLTTYRT